MASGSDSQRIFLDMRARTPADLTDGVNLILVKGDEISFRRCDIPISETRPASGAKADE